MFSFQFLLSSLINYIAKLLGRKVYILYRLFTPFSPTFLNSPLQVPSFTALTSSPQISLFNSTPSSLCDSIQSPLFNDLTFSFQENTIYSLIFEFQTYVFNSSFNIFNLKNQKKFWISSYSTSSCPLCPTLVRVPHYSQMLRQFLIHFCLFPFSYTSCPNPPARSIHSTFRVYFELNHQT